MPISTTVFRFPAAETLMDVMTQLTLTNSQHAQHAILQPSFYLLTFIKLMTAGVMPAAMHCM